MPNRREFLTVALSISSLAAAAKAGMRNTLLLAPTVLRDGQNEEDGCFGRIRLSYPIHFPAPLTFAPLQTRDILMTFTALQWIELLSAHYSFDIEPDGHWNYTNFEEFPFHMAPSDSLDLILHVRNEMNWPQSLSRGELVLRASTHKDAKSHPFSLVTRICT